MKIFSKLINIIKLKFKTYELLNQTDLRKIYQFNGSISHGSGEVTEVRVFVKLIDYSTKRVESKAISKWSYITGKEDKNYTWDWSEETWNYESLPDQIKREIKLDQIL